MATTKEIRVAIAARLNEEIDVFGVSPYMQIPPAPPMIEVYPAKTRYDEGLYTDERRFKVRVTAANTVTTAAQDLIDPLLDPDGERSVKAALELRDVGANATLGGVVDDLRVEEFSDYHQYPISPEQGGGHLLGIEFTVCCIVTRTG